MPGEHDVEEDEVGPVLAERADGTGPLGDVVDLESLVAQDDAEHLRQCQVVIDDEHATLHVGRSFPHGARIRVILPQAPVNTLECRETGARSN